ncbi:MAG TPA: hypothetical protein VN962_06755 [Polyangia bacterium]|nr:hypothetical protein [Polyangia bacterium]
MSITYSPPARHGRNNTARVQDALKAGADRYGAYVFSNRALAEETGLSVRTVVFTLQYLLKAKRWTSVPGPVELLADPAMDGRELRRLSVLIPSR